MKQLKQCLKGSHKCNACKYGLYGKRCESLTQNEVNDFKVKRAFIAVMG